MSTETMDDGYLRVSPGRYTQLIKAEGMLAALRDSGVENWVWYGEALDTYDDFLRDLEGEDE